MIIITTIDAHTAGEPLRIITGGLPPIPGDTILARRRYLRGHLDYLRTALMWEPRGHADMYGAILTPPVTPGADMGVIFTHNEGYSTMCGHGIIALATVLPQEGLLPLREPVTTLRFDTPAGLITAHAHVAEGRVQRVAFENVPAFVVALDETVEVPGLGLVRYDLAFGGAFYAYCKAEELGVGLARSDVGRLIAVGTAIKHAVMANRPIVHPTEPDLSFLYGTIITGPAHGPIAHSRNVCIFADGEVDRSPTGTGVSGRLALGYARGELALEQPFVVESITDGCFTGRVLRETSFGGFPAIIPEVAGEAYLTGRHQFIIDPNDPLRAGFLLR
ncbi:MAG: proline racemase family protein [Chloroflexaceae bacterium]|jgi:trans-L-3-hydroxyproline dehydratase|nr:proline racemase family protein [Chloroflexaceae bacterium]